MLILHHITRGWRLSLLLLAGLLLAGCQSTETFYRGYLADNQSVAPLMAEAQGSWQTIDIDLNYHTEKIDEMLNISGTIDFGLYHQLSSSRINRLNFHLFFLDNEAKVLQTASLARALYAQPETQLYFDTSLPVPSGAQSIAFGYEGKAQEDGGSKGGSAGSGEGGGGTFLFYDLPKRPN